MPTKTTVVTPSLLDVHFSYRHRSPFWAHCILPSLHLAVSGSAATANDTSQSKWSIFACFTTSQVHLDSIFRCIHKSTPGGETATQQFPSLPDFPGTGKQSTTVAVAVALDGFVPFYCFSLCANRLLHETSSGFFEEVFFHVWDDVVPLFYSIADRAAGLKICSLEYFPLADFCFAAGVLFPGLQLCKSTIWPFVNVAKQHASFPSVGIEITLHR